MALPLTIITTQSRIRTSTERTRLRKKGSLCLAPFCFAKKQVAGYIDIGGGGGGGGFREAARAGPFPWARCWGCVCAGLRGGGAPGRARAGGVDGGWVG